MQQAASTSSDSNSTRSARNTRPPHPVPLPDRLGEKSLRPPWPTAPATTASCSGSWWAPACSWSPRANSGAAAEACCARCSRPGRWPSCNALVIEATEDFVQRRLMPSAGQDIDLAETLQQLSIEIILRLVEPELAGPELDELTSALDAAVGYLDTRLFAPDKVEETDHDRFAADRKVLEDFIDERAARQTCPVTGRGLLADLAAALREDGKEADTGQALQEELLSVFVAGVETMGTLLTWIFHNMSAHPETRDRALGEVLAKDLGRLAALPSLPSGTLPYTRALVEESLRLHPPAWALFRRTDAPLEAAGIRLEVGDVQYLGRPPRARTLGPVPPSVSSYQPRTRAGVNAR